MCIASDTTTECDSFDELLLTHLRVDRSAEVSKFVSEAIDVQSSKSSPPTNEHPAFYRLDALPVAQPAVSEH